MKFYAFIAVLSMSLLSGCWDDSKSPTFSNKTGQDIVVHFVFGDREVIHTLASDASVLVPNTVLEQGVVRIEVMDERGNSASFSAQDIANYLSRELNELVINKDFSVQAIRKTL